MRMVNRWSCVVGVLALALAGCGADDASWEGLEPELRAVQDRLSDGGIPPDAGAIPPDGGASGS
ncbi:MAG: hypothetical protein EOO71_11530 [Myxococcaceae bacterium]|nr:MAG: hypothetical protein EOO71_11530 [Myxococcaceae bacterium]